MNLNRNLATLRHLSRATTTRHHHHHPASSLQRSLLLQPPNFTARTMASAMEKRLSGKTILITGASSGIGASTALEFARTSPKSLKLILTARRVDRLEELAATIRKEVGEGVKVLPVQLDVADAAAVRALPGKLPAEFAEVDVLINNAGLVKGVAQAPDIKEEDLNQMMATNVTGLINMTQAILPIFKKRPNGGAGDIVNIGSIAGREPYQGGSIYCATKAAVRSFTDAMRRELIATRIRVMEIDPGQVETVREILSSTSPFTDLWDPGVLGRQILRRQVQG